jgi:hypothetical protein
LRLVPFFSPVVVSVHILVLGVIILCLVQVVIRVFGFIAP